MGVSMDDMRLPAGAPQLKITATYWKFKREALSWRQIEELAGEGPWSARELVVKIPSYEEGLTQAPYAGERVRLENIQAMVPPLFEMVNDLFDFYPRNGQTDGFEEKCLEFAATYGALFFEGAKLVFSSDKDAPIIKLGTLDKWAHFVIRVRRVFEHIADPAASEDRRFAGKVINDLLKEYPTGFFLTPRMESTEGKGLAPILEREWSRSLACLVVRQLAEVYAEVPENLRCSWCGHYGPLAVMTMVEDKPGSFLTREDRIREGLPPDGDLWFHNRDKALNEKRKKAMPMDAPACYANLHRRVKRHNARKQNNAPNNPPVSPEK